MKVRDIMTPDVIGVPPGMRLNDLARLLLDRRISGAPVVDESGTVVGVISEADLLMKQVGHAPSRRSPLEWIFGERPGAEALRRRAATTVAEAMSAPPITVEADRPIYEAAAVMVERQVNRLPVIEAGRLVGILTRADMVRAYLRRDERALKAIREDVLRRTMWLDPDSLAVEVREGVASIGGTVDRRSTATIIAKLIGVVEGVDRVESDLRWKLDDGTLGPAGESEREPDAASLAARERPRPTHR